MNVLELPRREVEIDDENVCDTREEISLSLFSVIKIGEFTQMVPFCK
jgi:hypothetical protein